jgi:hypothetical protein
MTDDDASSIPCRICRESSAYFFSRSFPTKQNARYFKCPGCGHVQTEEPTWLARTYRAATFQLDVGMADRCIWTAQTMSALALKLQIDREHFCLDWGGGTGLFVRLCRDYGLNFFYTDPFSQNIFASGFEREAAGANPSWTCVSAFEVAEHFPDPLKNFGELFQLQPRYILFTTTLYAGEGPDWWYFGEDGQHVALYTRRSLEIVGRSHGFHLASNGADLHLFSRKPVPDRLLKTCRKNRDRLARKYRDKHGSRTNSDFEEIVRRFRLQKPGPL